MGPGWLEAGAGVGVEFSPGDELVGHRLRCGPRQDDQCAELLWNRVLSPQLHGPRQIGGLGGSPDPDSGPASGVDAG